MFRHRGHGRGESEAMRLSLTDCAFLRTAVGNRTPRSQPSRVSGNHAAMVQRREHKGREFVTCLRPSASAHAQPCQRARCKSLEDLYRGRRTRGGQGSALGNSGSEARQMVEGGQDPLPCASASQGPRRGGVRIVNILHLITTLAPF